MGSYSSSKTDSKTSNSNLPITLTDHASAVTGAGSDGSQIGGYANQNVSGGLGNISGSRFSDNHAMNLSNGGSYSVLDGGVINRAFDFGSNMVAIVADITKQNNAAAQVQSGQALQAAAAVGNSATEINAAGIAGTIEKNKTLIYGAAAVVVAYFVFFKKK
jgi:hypothetical protein